MTTRKRPALREYARKRDFRRSSEPAPGAAPRRVRQLRFVVQEHHASHLHYDFRLEWDGVLKSWAVPKGPPRKVGEKRLAVQVEDHPLSYAKFTGTIPAGEYGAGEVYRWDEGTWEPEGSAAEGLRKGHLDFTLHGTRLRGRWLLVRTRKETRQPQWLLIRRSADRSETPRARPAALPAAEPERFLPPQLAQLVREPPTGPGWLHEIKFDGYRLQIHAQGRNVKIFTRNGNDWTAKFPTLAREIAAWNVKSCILDGEAVVLDADGRSDFQRLQNALDQNAGSPVIFYAFDLLALGGRDLRELSLANRKQALAELLRRRRSRHLRLSRHFAEDAREFFENSCRLRLEGMISKRSDAPYRPGRGGDWVKTKCGLRQELVVGGFTEPRRSRSHFGALLVGYFEKGSLRYAGKVGTGFDRDTLKGIRGRLAPLETGSCPFARPHPRERGVHWVTPALVAEVAFSEWTNGGRVRAPVFLGLREDKPAASVVRERTGRAIARRNRAPSTRADRGADPFRALSHPDKVLFRDPRITKRDLAAYYLGVARFLLPQIANRPLSLLRCPDGQTAECFFQKHFREGAPEGVMGNSDFLSVNTPQGLVALVQRGALELHVRNTRAGATDLPDQFVIDFDPGPGVSWASVRRAALELKAVLDELGLRSFLKTTGGKGLHVHVPIAPDYPEADVKRFARALADVLVDRYPARYTANPSKAGRNGRIFVDYLRNGRGATAVAPYSVRARPGAPVALPLEWSELGRLRSSAAFPLPAALAKIRRRKRDPWEDSVGLRQELPLLRPASGRKAA